MSEVLGFEEKQLYQNYLRNDINLSCFINLKQLQLFLRNKLYKPDHKNIII